MVICVLLYDSFDGKIGKIIIWSTSNAEYDLSQILTGDEEGLEGYWKFSSVQGDKATYLSGNGRHTIVHNAQYSQK